MSPDKAMIGYLQARIAELEAELEKEHDLRVDYSTEARKQQARAEKAEAEVERLTDHHGTWHSYCYGENANRPGVNPSGDTLGEREDG